MNSKVEKGKELYFDVVEIENLKDMLNKSAASFAERPAFKYKEEGVIKEKTYEQTLKDVNALGTALLDLGLKGKRIAIIGDNSYEWAISYYATVCGTGVVVPIDKALPQNEIQNIIEKSGATAIFFEEKYIDKILEIQKNIPSLETLISFKPNDTATFIYDLVKKGNDLLNAGNNSFLNAEIDNKAMAMMLFTSGTTSASKAVMLSHYNVCQNVVGLRRIFRLFPEDVMLAFLPLHHTLACTVLLIAGLYNGASVAFCEGLRYIVPNLAEFKVTVLTTVPLVAENMYKKITAEVAASNGAIKPVDVVNKIDKYLRLMLVGAAALSKPAIECYRNMGLNICHGYGLTETAPVLAMETDTMKRAGSIGVSLPNVELEIVEPDSDGIGEIRAKGPNIMIGYYNNEEATNEIIKDGWLYTGDLGYVDKDGYIYVAGRKKNVIVLQNGKNIFPEEIEMLYTVNPLIDEALIYGKDEGRSDIIICIKIVYNEAAIKEKYGDISEEEILKIMNEFRKEVNKNLPIYKVVKELTITTEPFNKTTTGKIKRYLAKKD
jgi:long-chain acyl-CoA synthetase